MKRWLRRLWHALRLGAVWAGGGAALGLIIETVDALWTNPLGALVAWWVPLLATVGFVGGVAFGLILGVASRRHRFSELSLPGFTALGALGGLVLGFIALVSGLAGDVPDAWLRTVIVLAPPAAGCAVAAFFSLMSARTVEEQRKLEEGSAMRLFYGQR